MDGEYNTRRTSNYILLIPYVGFEWDLEDWDGLKSHLNADIHYDYL